MSERGHQLPSLSGGLRATTASLPFSYKHSTDAHFHQVVLSETLPGKVTARALGCSNTPTLIPLNQRGLLSPVDSERGSLG